ncbi:MAG: hypothetical protein KAR14_07830 [Candidatus Aminicenantes bacterium]|nr:hypothetical protein [Candidatus Aminicenantes bacterium]
MDDKQKGQMKIMTDAVQPYCDEDIIAAMTCSHSGSTTRTLIAKVFLGGFGASWGTSGLPNPVFLAVGKENIYAFDYKPRGFKFKIKKEAARWRRKDVTVESETEGKMYSFTISAPAGEKYPLEIPVYMGGKEIAKFFLDSMR